MKAEESPDFPKYITSARLSRPNEHILDPSSLVWSSCITPLLDSCTLAGCLYAWDWDSAFRKGILRTTKIFIYKWAMLYVREGRWEWGTGKAPLFSVSQRCSSGQPSLATVSFTVLMCIQAPPSTLPSANNTGAVSALFESLTEKKKKIIFSGLLFWIH